MQKFQHNQPLREFSTLGIGGNARLFTSVESVESLQEVLGYCYEHQIPFHPLGKGSNSLFDDRGFEGLVIHNKIAFLEIEGTHVSVGGGYSFALLGVKTARKGLSGLEFASGIPASVGGAIFMNAGAGEAETADVLSSVTFVDEKGEIHEFSRKQLSFSYRQSSFHEKKGVIAAATFELVEDAGARDKQIEIVKYRTKTQPYGELSCGCVFRNPEKERAGRLIEACGLKGKQLGGAEVSTLHANFIVNRDGATAEDVRKLALYVKECVKEKTGIELEMELREISYR